MKACIRCLKTMRSDRKSDLCRICASICVCGAEKDQRAAECMSCGMSRKVTAQWQNAAVRQKMLKAINKAQSRRPPARGYVGIQESNFYPRPDGRWMADYADADGKRRKVYRYRWRWEKANGPIPPRHHIHHVNHDRADDRLENLTCLTAVEHETYHGLADPDRFVRWSGYQRRPRITFACAHCGKSVTATERKDRPQLYCSIQCHNAVMNQVAPPRRRVKTEA